MDEGAKFDPELDEGAWNPVSEGKGYAINEEMKDELLTTKT